MDATEIRTRTDITPEEKGELCPTLRRPNPLIDWEFAQNNSIPVRLAWVAGFWAEAEIAC